MSIIRIIINLLLVLITKAIHLALIDRVPDDIKDDTERSVIHVSPFLSRALDHYLSINSIIMVVITFLLIV